MLSGKPIIPNRNIEPIYKIILPTKIKVITIGKIILNTFLVFDVAIKTIKSKAKLKYFVILITNVFAIEINIVLFTKPLWLISLTIKMNKKSNSVKKSKTVVIVINIYLTIFLDLLKSESAVWTTKKHIPIK